MRNSHGVCVKKTTEQTGMARPKTKQPKVAAIALLIVGIIVFGRGEQTLSAQTENISIAAAIPCPLFVPTSVTRDRNTDLPDTGQTYLYPLQDYGGCFSELLPTLLNFYP